MRQVRQLLLFVLLLAFWLLLSGQYNALFIGMGIGSAALATWFGGKLFDSAIGPASAHPRVSAVQTLLYVVWLFGRIVPSAIQVAWVIINPRRDPRPGMVRFRTELASPAARTTLANSITLVPGTMTVDVDGDEFTVHAFFPDAADDLATATMQNRIARVFRDDEQAAPEMIWEATPRPGPGGGARPPVADGEG